MARQIFIPDDYVHKLRSVERQLREFAQLVSDTQEWGPTLGGEILADNLDWLDCHLDAVERSASAPVTGAVRICPKRDGRCPKSDPSECDSDCGTYC